MLDNRNLREQGIILAQTGTSLSWRQAYDRQQQREVTARAQLSFSFLLNPGPQRRSGDAHIQDAISHLSDPPTFRVGFPTSMNPIFRGSLGQTLMKLFKSIFNGITPVPFEMSINTPTYFLPI